MKRMMTNAFAIAAAASWVMVAGAQSYPSGQSGQSEQPGWSESKSMKFTGCLKAGDTPNSFKLTNVQPAEVPGSGSTSGTSGSGTTGSGTTGSGSAAGMGSASSLTELELVATAASVDLSEHVGKRVEITGKAAKKDHESMSGTSGSGTSGATSGQSATEHNKKKIQVSAIRSLGDSCSGQ
jgi:hypothetical protein